MKHDEIKVLDEREWILKRPQIYLGSTTVVKQEFFFSSEGLFKEVEYIPALQKLFDEVIENSVDEHIKTKKKFANKIEIEVQDDGTVSVTDNGRGLPQDKHPQFPSKYTPEIIFTKLRSGSNFVEDRQGTIGLNGVGVSLVVLFSNKFYVETQSYEKNYSQHFDNMLLDIEKPKLTNSSKSTFTTIKFKPNFEYFQTDNWNFELLKKKIIDLSFFYPSVSFRFNGEKLEGKKFIDLIKGYTLEHITEEGKLAKIIVTSNEFGSFKFHSLVNGANTFKGGPHIEYYINELINNIRPKLEKKYKVTLKPSDIRNHISIFSHISINNPIFSGQTKEEIINQIDDIKPIFENILTDKHFKKILSNEVICNKIVEEARLKQQLKEFQSVKQKQKQLVKKKVAKLLDANDKDREKCILFLTEGDSAMGQSGLVRDPRVHGFLPLRGKILNVYNMSPSEILKNEEVQSLLNSIGLKIGEEPYDIRYGKIVLLTDEDEDGHSIKGLLISLFYKYWPLLFKQGKICFLKTPLYIAKKGNEKIYIYSKGHLSQLDGKLKGYRLKYFKGLGGLEEEDWEYFLNTNPQYVTLRTDENTKDILKIVFHDESEGRKQWLMT